MTYDRKVIKFDVPHMAKMHAELYLPQPILLKKVVVPTSQETPQVWRYTTSEPPEGWRDPDFDDSSWKTGEAGFGAGNPPNSTIRTKWNTPDIWIRRTFELEQASVANPHLRIYHDQDAEVYINGRQAAALPGYVREFTDVEFDDSAASVLKAGKNTIAVHCRQTRGGQCIDVGILEVTKKMPE
jgi:hypothetical protein